MARLEKLQIQGFRSFSPDETDPGPQKVDFVRRSKDYSGVSRSLVSPLTLILGQNGCGKTTIIECLRYVTTGDAPPGSHNGRNFVHDPKMARENVVNGNVKLQFRGMDNKLYVITRCMEATQKAKQVATKTLDATLTRKLDDGTMNSLSMKCADINAQMFASLGVTKPILNYVIFCHQEDSNWPLDEGSKVKDKFDEIFASAKYKECLKKIKDVRTKEMGQLKLDKKDLEYLAQDKKAADDKRKDLKKKEAARAAITDQLKNIQDQLKPVTEEMNEINLLERDFSGTNAKLTQAKTSLEHCQREKQQLKASLKEDLVHLSDLDIENLKQETLTKDKQRRDQVKMLGIELGNLSSKGQEEQDHLARLTAKIGECRAHKSNYDRDKKELNNTVVRVGQKLGWNLKCGFDDKKRVEEAIENVKDTWMAKEEKQRRQLDMDEAAIEEQQKVIRKLEIGRAQLEEQKKIKTEAMVKDKREVAKIRQQLNELDGFEAKLEAIQKAIERQGQEIEGAKNKVNIEQVKMDVAKNKAVLSTLLEKEAELKSELKRVEDQREVISEVNIKQADLQEKQVKLDRSLSKRNRELQQIFEKGSLPELKHLKAAYLHKSESLGSAKKRLESSVLRLHSDRERQTLSKKSLQSEIQLIDEKVKRLLMKLGEHVGCDFETEMASAKQEVERTRNELQVKEANKFTYQEFIDRLKRMSTSSDCKTACPTCSRPFDTSQEVDEVIDELATEIEKIPTKVRSMRTKLEKAEARLERLQRLYPDKKQADTLQEEIEDKKAALTSLEASLKKLEEQILAEEDRLEVASMDHSVCEDVREDVFNIDRLQLEIGLLTKKVAELSKNQDSTLRDYGTVREEAEAVFQQVTEARNILEQDQKKENQFEKRMNELEREANVMLNEKLKLEGCQQERANTEAKRKALEQQIASAQSDLRSLEEELRPKQREIDEAKEAKNRMVGDKDAAFQALRLEVEKVKKMQFDLEAVQGQVQEYEASGNEALLARLRGEHSALLEVKTSTEFRIKQLDKERSELQRECDNQENKVRLLEDNLRLRKYQEQEASFGEAVESYERQLQRLNYGSVEKRKRDLNAEWDRLESAKHSKKGRLDEMDLTLRDLKRELESPKLRLAEAKYRKKAVEETCRGHVINDLNKYYIALDWSIMRFHKERMQVINRIMKELWRATYRGNDIDYIEIKTEDVDTTHGADKKKSYNYRVVMVKNETELEMRGRCSAGQKVLASLIIRLALAETFSANCGMIALDEPTTNLDRDNIESLANALSELVCKRMRQSNFQLIVITHDEDLLDHLGRVDQVDHFFKVSRNERGHSTIRKNAISNR